MSQTIALIFIRIFKQILIAFTLLMLLWFLVPVLTKKEIRNDKPKQIKILLFVIGLIGVIVISIFGY